MSCSCTIVMYVCGSVNQLTAPPTQQTALCFPMYSCIVLCLRSKFFTLHCLNVASHTSERKRKQKTENLFYDFQDISCWLKISTKIKNTDDTLSHTLCFSNSHKSKSKEGINYKCSIVCCTCPKRIELLHSLSL